MILPFVNILFEQRALVEEGPGMGRLSLEKMGEPSGAAATPGNGTASDLQVRLKAGVLAIFRSDTPAQSLAKICLALLVVFFVKELFGYLQTFLMVSVEQLVIRDLRNDLFAHLNDLSLSFFHGERTGQLISRITNDVTCVRGALVATFANLFRESILTILYLGIAVWISWRLAIITLLVLVPIVFVITKIGRRLRKRSLRIQQKIADITATLEESISGVRVVKAFGMEEYEKRRFFGHTWDYFRTAIRMEFLSALAGPVTEYLGVVGVVVVLWYGGRQVLLDGSVSPDWFFIFLAATLSTMQPLRKLSKANTDLQIGLAAAGRIFGLLDTEPVVIVRPDAPSVERFRDRIAYQGVWFRYETGEDVLRAIDIEINKGEIVAIVGPSGAGKSTLLDLLPRFYDPTRGRITIDGHDLRDVDLGSLRALMGIVTQETILFNDTVRSNIAYGLEGARDDEIVAAARAANAHDFVSALPEGYGTVIGERGTMVSGGERQRIAIARAILKNPPILIFDEATSSLDSESERSVQEAIEHLFSGRTVLLIAHRLSTVRNADRIVVLDKGEMVEAGSHEELMRLGGLYRYLHDMQFADGPAERGSVGRDAAAKPGA
jgi:subfamily B ATP-binding cassette protein MsbA